MQINANRTAVFAGSNNITLEGVFRVAAGNNDATISNNLENGAVLTINNSFTNLKVHNRTLFIRGYGSTVWNGAIQDAADNSTSWDIRIHNDASFTMTGAANTYTGSTSLGQGRLIVNKTNPLGTAGNFNFYGGELQAGIDLSGANAIVNPVHLLGDPATVVGTNNIEFSGKLTNNNGTRKLQNNLTGGALLTLSGGVDLSQNSTNRTMWIMGSGNTLVNSVIADGVGATASALFMNGTGILELTGVNTYAGSTTVENGVLKLSGDGSILNSEVSVNGAGTLILDNSVTNSGDRIKDGVDFNLNHGLLQFISDGTSSSEIFGRLDINSNGLGKIQISGGGGSALTFASVNFANTGSTLDVTGITDLGTTNKILFSTAPTGTAVSNGILTKVLFGTDFAEYDATNGIQAYTGYNASNDLNAADSTHTMNVTASANITGNRTLNALKLDHATGVTIGSSGGQNATLTLTGGALLALGGGTHVLDVPLINMGANNGYFQVAADTTLDVNGSLTGGAFTLLQDGTINFNSKQFFLSTLNIHSGTVKLNGGLNTILNSRQPIFINEGGTLDLNGQVQYSGYLLTSSSQPGIGGTLTSSAGMGTFIGDYTVNASWMGTIEGSVNFGRINGFTLTIGTAQTYTGWTYLTGGTTTLRDDAALQNTSGIDINVATLYLANNDNLQRQNNNRINDTAAINLRAGTLTVTGAVKAEASETLGAVSALLGANVITGTTAGLGTNGVFSSMTLSIESLSRSAGATINFTGSNLGAENNNAKILFGTPLAPAGDGVLGAWAFANTTDYAAYNASNGVGAIGGGGFRGYDADFASGNITNLGMGSAAALTTTLAPGTTTTALLRFHGGFTNNLEFTSGTDTLHLELGGILRSNNNNLTSIGTLAARGVITSGTNELVVYNNQSTLTIHSVIQGATSLVKSGAGTLTLTADNTYSGGTVVNQATLRLEGDLGTVVLPNGGLTITSGTVTMVANAGQIGSSNTVTLNGSSTLTMLGDNVLDKIVFNHIGGSTSPTVTSGGVLTLTNATPISVTTNSAFGVPTINGTLNLGSGAKTIHADAPQMNGVIYDTSMNASLLISAGIIGDGLSITKTGTGLVEFAGQNQFDSLTVSGGGVILGASSATTTANGLISGPLGRGSVAMASGTKLGVDNNNRAIANSISFAGDPVFTNIGTSTFTMTLNGGLTFSTLTSSGLVANVDTPFLNVVLGGRITDMDTVTAIGSAAGPNTITKTGLGNISGLNITGLGSAVPINIDGLTNLNTFSLLHDGDTTSSFEMINLGVVDLNPVNGGNDFADHPIALETANYGTAYKTLSLASLNSSVLPNGITLVNNNGYGLIIPDAITLSATNNWAVNNASTLPAEWRPHPVRQTQWYKRPPSPATAFSALETPTTTSPGRSM
ncbi:MAG: autotransporter-associated beta strand repeat-containing protein [Prosthecobacter sp.]